MAKNWNVKDFTKALNGTTDEAKAAIADAGRRFPLTVAYICQVNGSTGGVAFAALAEGFPEWATLRKIEGVLKGGVAEVEDDEPAEEEVAEEKPAKKEKKEKAPKKAKKEEPEEEAEAEEEEEEKPAKKAKKEKPAKKDKPAKKAKKAKEEEDEEEDDDDDDDSDWDH